MKSNRNKYLSSQDPSENEQIFTIDLTTKTTPFPHYWEKCVGSGHALLALREDWRQHLKKCHDELGFQYVRFHGLLNDDMSVYKKGKTGPVYSFFNVDSIFDFLQRIGMKPFVELSFMPRDMASGEQTIFHYRGNVTPPKDYNEWAELIRRLTRHLVDRYGVEEVRSWFFEVWNEPNLKGFWSGTQEEYFSLYKHTAAAIKEVDLQIKVGGPSTAANSWIPEMLEYCRENNVPLDFISTHHYPTDVRNFDRNTLHKMTIKAREEAGDLPLCYTEWNNSPSSRDHLHDEPYAAAFVVKTIVDNQGLVDIYSFWTFSDIFEEAGFPSKPFHGGFGLLNLHGVPKPTYRAFQLLHRTGSERVPVVSNSISTVEVLATKGKDKLLILIYNHDVPLAPIKEETIRIRVMGARSGAPATIERIDEDSANPKRRWVEMGSPEYLDEKMIDELLKSSEMPKKPLKYASHGGDISFNLTIPPHGVAAVTLDLIKH